MKTPLDVIIVGAGPYGLSAAAHLRSIPGLQVRAFGQPMSFWKEYMPAGMLLRSQWDASHLSDPEAAYTLDTYVSSNGNHCTSPIPLDRFIDYGIWFQSKAVPDLDTRKIRLVESAPTGFRVTAEDGEVLQSKRVVVAAGIATFARRPAEFQALPPSLVSHSGDHTDLGRFSGKRVLVLGAGQSALESAALLRERGAIVELVVRNPQIHWLRWRTKISKLGAVGHLLHSKRDVGPPGLSLLVARPGMFTMLPRGLQESIARRSIRPAGSAWVRDRLHNVPTRIGRSVKSATPSGDQLRVVLSDGTEVTVDHLMCGTGYRVDLAKYSFLSRELVERIEQVDGYPRLRAGLESSIQGLHFLGAPAAWSIGPLARFVSGAHYSVEVLTRAIARAA